MKELPLWMLYILCTLGAILAIELGVWLGRFRRRSDEKDVDTPTNAVVGAILGLLAFLLALTFSMAAERYNVRRENVLHEANAIQTTYLRADFLPEAERGEVRRILREYVAHRAGGMTAVMSPEGLARSTILQNQLWAITARVGVNHNSESTALFITSVNETLDLSAIRLAALRNKIPSNVWLMFAIVTFFSMIAIGYEFGLTEKRSWTATLLLVLAFTSVIVMIADLDSPQAGLLQISQQPLIDVLNAISTTSP